MSFRKRNVVLASSGSTGSLPTDKDTTTKNNAVSTPGIRPSPVDGRLTTSTGTQSLDTLLAGHAGFALGTSILLEEDGTTDFGGALLRYYAAEGIVQGHHVHVMGMSDAWGKELPGLSEGGSRGSGASKGIQSDKMKIAWRYERLGEFGRDRKTPESAPNQNNPAASIFCHDFDLSKRLTLQTPSLLKCLPLAPLSLTNSEGSENTSPFDPFLHHLNSQISSAPPTAIHRIVIPNFLSPAIYPYAASWPHHVLPFLHGLRALLKKHSTQTTAMVSLPSSLFPRSAGLTRWIEILNDGVMELLPFPATSDRAALSATPGSGNEDMPQGMLKIHRLPIAHEKGSNGGSGDDLAFTLSRRKGLVIKPFSLPPVEGDTEAQQEGLSTDTGGKATKIDIEF